MEDPIKKSKLHTSLHEPIRFCDQFKAYNVFFHLREEIIQEVTPVVTKNAFSILMNNKRVLPDKLSKPKNNFDISFNSMIDYFKELNISWPKTLVLNNIWQKPFNQWFGTLPVTMNILLKSRLPSQLALQNSKI